MLHHNIKSLSLHFASTPRKGPALPGTSSNDTLLPKCKSCAVHAKWFAARAVSFHFLTFALRRLPRATVACHSPMGFLQHALLPLASSRHITPMRYEQSLDLIARSKQFLWRYKPAPPATLCRQKQPQKPTRVGPLLFKKRPAGYWPTIIPNRLDFIGFDLRMSFLAAYSWHLAFLCASHTTPGFVVLGPCLAYVLGSSHLPNSLSLPHTTTTVDIPILTLLLPQTGAPYEPPSPNIA